MMMATLTGGMFPLIPLQRKRGREKMNKQEDQNQMFPLIPLQRKRGSVFESQEKALAFLQRFH